MITSTGTGYCDMLIQLYVPELQDMDVDDMWFNKTVHYLTTITWVRLEVNTGKVNPNSNTCLGEHSTVMLIKNTAVAGIKVL